MRKTTAAVGVVASSLLVVTALPTLATAASKFTEVVVRNTDSEAIPTKAVGTAKVEVTNLPAGSDAPVDRYLAQVAFTAFPDPDSTTTCSDAPALVPDGKRFVVERMTFEVTNGTTAPYLTLFGVGVEPAIPLVRTQVAGEDRGPDAPQDRWAAVVPGPLVLGEVDSAFNDQPGGSELQASVCIETGADLRSVRAQFAGYLEDAPAP